MCVAIPGKVVEFTAREPLITAKVDFGGVIREICLQSTPEAKVGDYVLAHAGFSISIIDENEAEELLSFLRKIQPL